MEVSKKLNELLLLCSKQNVEFSLEIKGPYNRIYFTGPPENRLEISIGDVDDDNLLIILDEKIAELKNLFK